MNIIIILLYYIFLLFHLTLSYEQIFIDKKYNYVIDINMQ